MGHAVTLAHTHTHTHTISVVCGPGLAEVHLAPYFLLCYVSTPQVIFLPV